MTEKLYDIFTRHQRLIDANNILHGIEEPSANLTKIFLLIGDELEASFEEIKKLDDEEKEFQSAINVM